MTVDYSPTYDPDTDVDRWCTDATAEAVAAWIRPGDRVLELGSATGRMTAVLAQAGATVLGVERSLAYACRAMDRQVPGARVVIAAVEDICVTQRFHHVTATGLLHELPDPRRCLANAVAHLAPGGLLHVSVPNPDSLHRLVAVEAGLIGERAELSATAQRYGVPRHWSLGELVDLAAPFGLEVRHREGILVKPLSNAQLAELPERVMAGFVAAARHLPDHCAMHYVVFGRFER